MRNVQFYEIDKLLRVKTATQRRSKLYIMRGWFDAFRTDGGPTLYSYSNRTSVTGDISSITVCLVFITIYIAFLIIFPGVRKEKFSTFCSVTLSLLTGMVICSANFGSYWEVSSGEIVSSYRAFSAHKLKASLGILIGLDHANITLKVIPTENSSLDIDFNERFYWNSVNDMSYSYHKALVKGLPYPILTAAEYLTIDKEAFVWGRSYRNAGYYTSIALWAAFASWLLANILLLNVPRYGAYMLMLTGCLMVAADLIYLWLKPTIPLMIRIEESLVTFQLGFSFWMTIVVGSLTAVSGLIISITDWIYPHKFSTILEVDFDTPYDRHIIIEDSHDTRKRRFKIPRLEEPLNVTRNVGSRLLRRLSKRGGKEANDNIDRNPGLDNLGFEMEVSGCPKSPWKSSLMKRGDSKNSNRSVLFKTHNHGNFLDVKDFSKSNDTNHIPVTRTESSQLNLPEVSVSTTPNFREKEVCCAASSSHIERQDSCHSCASSSSSLGLEILTRGSSVYKPSGEENNHQLVTRNNSGNIIVFHRTDSRGQLQSCRNGNSKEKAYTHLVLNLKDAYYKRIGKHFPE